MINFKKTSMPSLNMGNVEEYKDRKLIHTCEACNKREILTPEEGYRLGWDYSPYMYPFGVISPRTCPSCGIETSVYWEITVNKKGYDDLTDSQKQIVQKIYNEPESILAE